MRKQPSCCGRRRHSGNGCFASPPPTTCLTPLRPFNKRRFRPYLFLHWILRHSFHCRLPRSTLTNIIACGLPFRLLSDFRHCLHRPRYLRWSERDRPLFISSLRQITLPPSKPSSKASAALSATIEAADTIALLWLGIQAHP